MLYHGWKLTGRGFPFLFSFFLAELLQLLLLFRVDNDAVVAERGVFTRRRVKGMNGRKEGG